MHLASRPLRTGLTSNPRPTAAQTQAPTSVGHTTSDEANRTHLGSRGSRFPSRRYAVLWRTGHIRIGYPIHHFCLCEPRNAGRHAKLQVTLDAFGQLESFRQTMLAREPRRTPHRMYI